MAAITHPGSIKKHFCKLKDPRVAGRTRHLLIDIVVIAVCGVIGDCDDWPDIVQFAQKREAWFKRFLKLPNGIPAHDTFERVFAHIDPRAFERCCVEWLRTAASLVGVKHIAIDGKTLCGSGNAKLRPLHLVSAWAVEANLSLGQVAVDHKSNEITAIPMLLELLDLKGALVSTDAMGCQKAIAAKVVERGGDYLFYVKGNQEHLLQDIQATVERALDGNLPAHTYEQHTKTEQSHGRREERSCVVINSLTGIRDRRLWPGLSTVGMCSRERIVNGETITEVRYFIGSRQMRAHKYAQALRKHWAIENNLHWHLDVSFGEDGSQIEDRNGAENFALLRKLALSLLKRHPSKGSIARKRKAAALDPEFLAEVLAGANEIEKV
jgi:predicted transposase YbfD/YdcC